MSEVATDAAARAPRQDVTVRHARTADASAIAALVTELGYPVDATTIEVRLGMLGELGETVLVAEHGGTVVGVLTVHTTPVLHRAGPVGRLTMLVVTERMRSRGVGARMVMEAERILAAKGCVLVEVTSNRTRTDAHRFYERQGYEITSVRLGKPIEPAP